jgi:hypothetical protein
MFLQSPREEHVIQQVPILLRGQIHTPIVTPPNDFHRRVRSAAFGRNQTLKKPGDKPDKKIVRIKIKEIKNPGYLLFFQFLVSRQRIQPMSYAKNADSTHCLLKLCVLGVPCGESERGLYGKDNPV